MVANTKEVFITYAWQNDIENTKVDNFVVALRQKGIDSIYDKAMIYDDINRRIQHGFGKDNIIIILSEMYKHKIDNNQGKVSEEWNLIYHDYAPHPQKYIFVSFDKNMNKETRKKITPDEFWGLGNAGDILIYNINFNENGKVLENENLNKLVLRIYNLPEFILPNVDKNTMPTPKKATGVAQEERNSENTVTFIDNKNVQKFSTKIDVALSNIDEQEVIKSFVKKTNISDQRAILTYAESAVNKFKNFFSHCDKKRNNRETFNSFFDYTKTNLDFYIDHFNKTKTTLNNFSKSLQPPLFLLKVTNIESKFTIANNNIKKYIEDMNTPHFKEQKQKNMHKYTAILDSFKHLFLDTKNELALYITAGNIILKNNTNNKNSLKFIQKINSLNKLYGKINEIIEIIDYFIASFSFLIDFSVLGDYDFYFNWFNDIKHYPLQKISQEHLNKIKEINKNAIDEITSLITKFQNNKKELQNQITYINAIGSTT